MNRRLRIALIIIAGAVLALITLLAIETFLIDTGDLVASRWGNPLARAKMGVSGVLLQCLT